jgi:hypothetical protein
MLAELEPPVADRVAQARAPREPAAAPVALAVVDKRSEVAHPLVKGAQPETTAARHRLHRPAALAAAARIPVVSRRRSPAAAAVARAAVVVVAAVAAALAPARPVVVAAAVKASSEPAVVAAAVAAVAKEPRAELAESAA